MNNNKPTTLHLRGRDPSGIPTKRTIHLDALTKRQKQLGLSLRNQYSNRFATVWAYAPDQNNPLNEKLEFAVLLRRHHPRDKQHWAFFNVEELTRLYPRTRAAVQAFLNNQNDIPVGPRIDRPKPELTHAAQALADEYGGLLPHEERAYRYALSVRDALVVFDEQIEGIYPLNKADINGRLWVIIDRGKGGRHEVLDPGNLETAFPVMDHVRELWRRGLFLTGKDMKQSVQEWVKEAGVPVPLGPLFDIEGLDDPFDPTNPLVL